MGNIKITISGPGATFGSITKCLELFFKGLGADVEVKLDHESAIVEEECLESLLCQIENRNVVIETESLPWGG